jgi:23S rRNA (uracil1939-C5)-methyltransferase
MVSIFKAPKKQKQRKKLILTIDRLDHEGRGVCRHHNPIVFVPQTLPGERCEVEVKTSGRNFSQGSLIKILDKNEHRIEPNCRYFELCGGCQTQYSDAEYMLSQKQSALSSLFQKQLGVNIVPWQPPLIGDNWHYRRKARLAVDAQNIKAIKLGFRSENNNAVLDINDCPVLDKSLNMLLPELKQLLPKIVGLKHLGHIGMLRGNNGVQLAFRFTKDINKLDRELLRGFADRLDLELVLEIHKNQFETLSKANENMYIASGSKTKLYCEPNDFIQVNDKVNQQMVAQASDWLSLGEEDILADLFCGIGNFSLALADGCCRAIGLEGIATMVDRASRNAQLNAVENVAFDCIDLNQANSLKYEGINQCNVMVLDPSRAGAKEVVEQVNPLQWKKILYVSCHAGTFARDAKIMQSKGFEMVKVSVLDMFPQTSHIELMALFLPAR